MGANLIPLFLSSHIINIRNSTKSEKVNIKNYVMGGAHLLLTIVNVILFFFESTLAYAFICLPIFAIFAMISSFFLYRAYSKYNLKKLKEYVSKLQ